jgi:DNA polymerase-3 subunit delta
VSNPALHLVLGDEELLAERAVAAVVAAVRAQDPTADVQHRRAGEVSGPELAEMLSPSLFAEARVIVLESVHEAGKDAAALVISAAADLPDGVTLVVRHAGGARGKAVADALVRAEATTHRAAKLKGAELAAFLPTFVRAELAAAGARAAGDAVSALVDAVGSDLRELAAACSQLVADTGGRVDVVAVRRYHQGRAEVTGFDVADAAVSGDRAAALEALRWAVHRGVADVLLADALADAVRTIARVGAAGRGDPFRMASELGMPPWKVKKAQAQSRGWTPRSVGAALQVVAALNADVKGAAADPAYAIERAVLAVVDLRAA